MKADLEAGLVGNLERHVAGEVIADLLGLAREVLADDRLNVAAVLTAAAFEDNDPEDGFHPCDRSGQAVATAEAGTVTPWKRDAVALNLCQVTGRNLGRSFATRRYPPSAAPTGVSNRTSFS